MSTLNFDATKVRPFGTPSSAFYVLDGAILSHELNDYGNWIAACKRDRTPQDDATLVLFAGAPDLARALSNLLVIDNAITREAARVALVKAGMKS